MILISIGMPSRFTQWCDAVITRLAERSFGTVEAVALNTLEDLATAVLKTRGSRLVVCSRQPVIRLQTEIVESKRPFLVAIGDPRSALRDLLQQGGYDLIAATRAVASSCAAIFAVTKAPGALVLPGEGIAEKTAMAMRIADHFGLPLNRSEVAEIVDGLLGAGVTSDHDETSAWWSGLSERERAIVDGALPPFVSGLSLGAGLEPLVWEPELFFIDDGSSAPTPASATGLVDITGRVRFLVYGPYVTLPPGSWSANVVLGFSTEAAGMGFTIEVFAGRQLSHTRIEPAAEQIIEINLHFAIDNSVDQPVQIRIVNERAAFDGRLALGYVKIAPQAEMRPQARDNLVAALRK